MSRERTIAEPADKGYIYCRMDELKRFKDYLVAFECASKDRIRELVNSIKDNYESGCADTMDIIFRHCDQRINDLQALMK